MDFQAEWLEEKETSERFRTYIDNFFGNVDTCREFSELTEFPSADPIYMVLEMDGRPIHKSLLRHCVDRFDLPTLLIRCLKFISKSDVKESAGEGDAEEKPTSSGDMKTIKELVKKSALPFVESGDQLADFIESLIILIVDMTDLSQDLCEQFGRRGCLQELLDILRSSVLPDINKQHTLTCVYNCCRRVSENRAICRGAIDMFEDLTKSSDLDIQADAFLTMSYVVDKTETSKISLHRSCVEFLLTVLTEALRSPAHRCRGYSVLEIVQGINQVAINDSNKCLIQEQGGLDLLERILQDDACSEEEQRYAARGIWQLAFVEDNKTEIRRRGNLLESLNTLKETSADHALQDACSGALFVINDFDKRPREAEGSHGGTGVSCQAGSREGGSHIMISYQHSNQAIVLKLKDYLVRQGYNVWMDVDKMKGDILEAMARAVQRSAVVLLCLSQKFKESQSCRTEATYAYTLKKDIIPLMLQEGYTPDDWLGALMGMKLYYPMYSQEQMDTNLPQLIGVLGGRGQLESPLVPTHTPKEGGNESAIPNQRGPTDETDSSAAMKAREGLDSVAALDLPKHPQAANLQPSNGPESWDKQRVQDWLESIGLDNETNSNLEKLNGTRMSQIYGLMNRAPEYCVQSLERELGLGFWDVLSFVSALESLYNV